MSVHIFLSVGLYINIKHIYIYIYIYIYLCQFISICSAFIALSTIVMQTFLLAIYIYIYIYTRQFLSIYPSCRLVAVEESDCTSGKNSDIPNESSDYGTKISDGEAQVLKLWRLLSTPSFPLLPVPL